MAFNNLEHFHQFIDDENFISTIRELKYSLWNKWIEKHLGEPENKEEIILWEAYPSLYNQLNEVIFWDIVDSTEKEYMFEKFEQLKKRYDWEDKLSYIQENWKQAQIEENKEKIEYWKLQYNKLTND